MSEQQYPSFYQEILELFQQTRQIIHENALQMKETDRKFQETDRKFQETALQMKETDRKFQETDRIVQETALQMKETDRRMDKTAQVVADTTTAVGSLSDKVGDMVERLLGEGNLVDQFRALGHRVKTHSRKKHFGEKGTTDSGEIDLFLEDGDVAILVEAKTTLSKNDVVTHIKRLEKYRRFVDADGDTGKHFVGAVAGTVIAENVINFAHENGLYVIVQSARAVEIIAQPEGFTARKW